MKTLAAVAVLALLLPGGLLAHAGEVHTYMGTVTTVHSDGSFVMKKTDGAEITVLTSPATKFLFSDDSAASRADLAAGTRVVVRISTDGKTATSVKMKPKTK